MELYIELLIIVVLILFIIIVITGWILAKDKNNKIVPRQVGDLLSPCIDSICKEGLICDPTNFTCRLGPGMKCLNGSECVTGLFCSGVCTDGPFGNLNEFCPCNQGYVCILQEDQTKKCLGDNGTQCNKNSDCASNICVNNKCVLAPNAFPCKSNLQCSSKNCSLGFCQDQGVISGTIGSSCSGNCVNYTGAQCKNDLVCQCINGPNNPGSCVSISQGILDSCSKFQICSPSLVCLNNKGFSCDSNNCTCLFNYIDPNNVNKNVCINGMSLNNFSRCVNNIGLGCENNFQCISGNCSGNSVLVTYQFNNDPKRRLNFINSTNVSVLKVSEGPYGKFQPYKMFSKSDGDIDTIYLVDSLQGLYYLQYNPILNLIITPWKLLIPHEITVSNNNQTDTKILIDVAYNGTNFIVAFYETLINGNSNVQNYTIYIGKDTNDLTPFNVLSGNNFKGLPGTQYSEDYLTPIPISNIDVSKNLDVLLFFNGTVYIKNANQTLYSPGVIKGGPSNGKLMTDLTSPIRFYNIKNSKYQTSDNITFVGVANDTSGNIYYQVIQFSGDLAEFITPFDRFNGKVQYYVFDYDIYISPEDISKSGIIMLTKIVVNDIASGFAIVLNYGSTTIPIPYNIGANSRVTITQNAYYIFSPSSCV